MGFIRVFANYFDSVCFFDFANESESTTFDFLHFHWFIRYFRKYFRVAEIFPLLVSDPLSLVGKFMIFMNGTSFYARF